MTRYGAIVVALAVSLLAACGDSRERQVDELFAAYRGDGVPGASVMVIRDGQRLLVRSYGMADLDAGIPVRPETNFRLASITKQFTAAAILLLVERGELDLDDTLTELFPGFPAYGADVTLRHLLRHGSGLVDYESLIPEEFEGQVSDHDALRMMMEVDRTYFEPGTAFRYSNTGYALMAVLIEQRSGMTFPSFLENNIFAPLGMDDTVAFEAGVSTVPDRAFGYTVEDGEVTFSDQSTTSAVLGDGGVYTSVLDYYRWDQALYTDELLSTASREAMWTAGGHGYGYGWYVDRKDARRRLHHDGSTSGFRNYVIRYPDERLTVLVLTNRRGPDVMPLAEAVAELYLDERE